MKKIFTLFACVAAMSAITSCDWFVLDNQESWDASVEGKLIDAVTGQPVPQLQGDSFSIVEKGWHDENPQPQTWSVKSNGTYVNKLVWAGDYYMSTKNGNYVADVQEFSLKKGNNTVDFKVNPYARISDVKVTYDAASKKIKATCKVESSLPDDIVNNIGEVRLCCFTDRFVAYNHNNCANDALAVKSNVSKNGEVVTLEIDTTDPKNAYEFTYNRAHYVRVAAIGAHYAVVPLYEKVIDWDNPTGYEQYGWYNYKDVYIGDGYSNDGTSNSDNKYNYSSVFKIDTDGTVTEITEW